MAISSVLQILAVIAIVSSAILGVVAIIAPKAFAALAGFCGTWVTIRPTVPYLDARIDIDRFVLRRTRLFGWVVVGFTAVCGVLLTCT